MRGSCRVFWSFLLSLVVACTEPRFVVEQADGGVAGPSQNPPTGLDPDGWVPRPDWPAQLQRMAPERDLNARVVRVVPDPARGQFWVLTYAVVAPDVAPRFALRRYDREGKPTWSSIDSSPFRENVDAVGGVIGDFAVHDDGSVSVLVLTPFGAFEPKFGAWSTLSFLRLDADANLLREVPFTAPLEPEEPAWCELVDAVSWQCRLERQDDQPNIGLWLGFWREKGMGFPLSNRLVADGNGLIMLRATEGYRLQRLDESYRVVADAIVLPGGSNRSESAPRLARDSAGHVVVMHTADESMLRMLAAGDGPVLSLSDLPGVDVAQDALLLQYFDARSMRRLSAHVIAPPESMLPSALVGDGDEVVAVLNFSPLKRDLPRDRGRDVVLVRSRVGGVARTYQRFNVAYSDAAADAAMVGGRLWLAGITNDERVGEDVVGLVTSVDREGDVGPVLRLAGPRSVQVDVIADDGAGGLLIGGMENVPNLNWCAQSAARCESRAFVGTMRTPEPGPRMRADLAPLPSASWTAPR